MSADDLATLSALMERQRRVQAALEEVQAYLAAKYEMSERDRLDLQTGEITHE